MPCRFPDSLTPWGQRCGHREGPAPEGPPPSQHTWDTPQPAHLGPPQTIAWNTQALGRVMELLFLLFIF